MKIPSISRLITGATLLSAAVPTSSAAFTKVLKDHVSGETVRYADLKKIPSGLESYLETFVAVTKKSFNSWNRDQQMAYLINFHNAATWSMADDRWKCSTPSSNSTRSSSTASDSIPAMPTA